MLHASTLPAGAVLCALALCACGDSRGLAHRPLIACNAPGDDVDSMAIAAFLEKVTPKPKRFLVPVGTDSALPTGAQQALQERGPTFLYPADPKQQAAVRNQLAARGAFPTLLVTYRGKRRLDDSRAVVRVGGHFVGGVENGQSAPSRAIYFECDTAHWHVARAEEERSS